MAIYKLFDNISGGDDELILQESHANRRIRPQLSYIINHIALRNTFNKYPLIPSVIGGEGTNITS